MKKFSNHSVFKNYTAHSFPRRGEARRGASSESQTLGPHPNPPPMGEGIRYIFFKLGSYRKFALLVFAGFLSACVGNEVENAPILSSILPPVEQRLENEQPRVPADVAKSVGGFYEAPAFERKLSSIAAKLREASDRPNLRYSVTILNSSAINAFALPDGQVFVTRGLLALANDEAEIASVLAHEMAHIEANHTAARMEQAQSAVLASRVVMNVLGDKKVAQAALVSGALSLASFSRAQELQADGIGIKMAARAGFDPYGAARFLENLDRAAALDKLDTGKRVDDNGKSFFASHPSGPQRIAAAVMTARQWGARGIGIAERNAYLEELDGMIYGDDPSQGLVRGQSFIHPYFGFAFTAPDGFKLENTHQAVLGLSADDRALRFDKLPKSDLALDVQLRASAAQDLKIEKLKTMTINGHEAATAIARSPGWTFRIVLVRKDSETYRFIFVNRKFNARDDEEFLASARSFHKLDDQEAAVSQPLRLRVVDVRPGDMPETFVQEMSIVDRPLERFLVLNGIDRGQVLQPGGKVKIVSAE
jgi:predicted Zn-dependent protease